MFFPHFDVLCDVLDAQQHGIFFLYNEETNYYSFFTSKCFIIESRTRRKKPFDVICCLYKIGCSAYQRVVIGPDKTRHCQTSLKWIHVGGKRTVKAELNCEI